MLWGHPIALWSNVVNATAAAVIAVWAATGNQVNLAAVAAVVPPTAAGCVGGVSGRAVPWRGWPARIGRRRRALRPRRPTRSPHR